MRAAASACSALALQQEVRQPLAHPVNKHRVDAGVQVPAQPAQLVHRTRDVAAGSGVVGGVESQPAAVKPSPLLRLFHPVPERERLVEMPVRLGRGGQPLGLLACPHRRGESAGNVVTGQVVVGQLGRRAWYGGQPCLVGQELGQPCVQPGPLAGQQVGVDRLADQRMPERVPFVAVGDQELVRDRLPDALLVLRRRQPGRLPDDVVVHPPAGHRRGAQHLLGARRQPLHPGHEQPGQPGRQLAAVRGSGEQLLGVVRVALGAPDDRVDRGRFQPLADQRGQVLGHRGGGQRAELDRGDARQPEQLADDAAQRMAPVQVVRPVRGDDRDPLTVQHPAEERDQVAGGAVGPVQVLQDQQHRTVSGDLGEHAQHRAEQLLLGHPRQVGAGLPGAGPVRQQPAEYRARGQRVQQRGCGGRAGRGVPQGVGQRQVRHAVAELGAAAGQHREVPLGPDGQLRRSPARRWARPRRPDQAARPAWPARAPCRSAGRKPVARLQYPSRIRQSPIPAGSDGSDNLRSVPADRSADS